MFERINGTTQLEEEFSFTSQRKHIICQSTGILTISVFYQNQETIKSSAHVDEYIFVRKVK